MTIGWTYVGQEVHLTGAQFQCANVPDYRRGHKRLTNIMTLDIEDESDYLDYYYMDESEERGNNAIT